jgi:Fe-S-cluster-containing dehydrogenase component
MRNGLLIDTQYCSGCRSCELACRNEKGLPLGQWGIKLGQVGPFEVGEAGEGRFIWNFTPQVTELCDLCAKRVAAGEKPACVHNCLADAISYGPLDELARVMDAKGKMAYLMIP